MALEKTFSIQEDQSSMELGRVQAQDEDHALDVWADEMGYDGFEDYLESNPFAIPLDHITVKEVK